MDIGAITATLTPTSVTPSSSTKPDEVARDFEALLWQMLIKESRMFESGLSDTAENQGGAIGSLLDQVLASQLAKGMDFGIGRAALGLPAERAKP